MHDVDPLAPIVSAALALAGLLLAALSLWLLLALALTVAAQTATLGTRAARVATAVLQRLAPAAVRQAIALGVGLALSLAAAPASGATSPIPAPPGTAPGVPSLDWPAAAAGVAPAGPLARATTAASREETVLVRAGDSLWRIAERSLRADGNAAVTARRVAARWPLWWQANREVIGDDPDLIRPGARLTAPPG